MTDGRMSAGPVGVTPGGPDGSADGWLPSADYAALAAVLAVALRSAGIAGRT